MSDPPVVREEEQEDDIMSAKTPSRPARELTESDIRDPVQCMDKHLAEMDFRLAEQRARSVVELARANGAVKKLKADGIGSSSRFSLKAFASVEEPCWQEALGRDSQIIKPCTCQPPCLEFEKARKALQNDR